jgi:hypothetical protein
LPNHTRGKSYRPPDPAAPDPVSDDRRLRIRGKFFLNREIWQNLSNLGDDVPSAAGTLILRITSDIPKTDEAEMKFIPARSCTQPKVKRPVPWMGSMPTHEISSPNKPISSLDKRALREAADGDQAKDDETEILEGAEGERDIGYEGARTARKKVPMSPPMNDPIRQGRGH